MSGPVILYSLFADAAKYTFDAYWKDLLIACSRGHFPTSIRYDTARSILIVRVTGAAGKAESFPMVESAVELFSLMIFIFRTKLGLRSPRELILQETEMAEINSKRSESIPNDWRKIRPRQRKEQLITDFVAKEAISRNLTTSEIRKLTAKLMLGLQFHSISPDDINCVDGVITEIAGLKFNKNTRLYSFPEITTKTSRMDKISTVHRFSSVLDKFAKDQTARQALF